jgi:hypothetical protein
MQTLHTAVTRCKTFDSAPVSKFAELLGRAGFRVRGRRADCAHCEGSSRLTVSIGEDVAHCHRCKWSGNLRTVSRELGIELPPERDYVRAGRARRAQFAEWRDTCYTVLIRRLRRLRAQAHLAQVALRYFPDFEPAWDALAELYHNEARIFGALDFLACDSLSPWLDLPTTEQRLFEAFSEALERVNVE